MVLAGTSILLQIWPRNSGFRSACAAEPWGTHTVHQQMRCQFILSFQLGGISHHSRFTVEHQYISADGLVISTRMSLIPPLHFPRTPMSSPGARLWLLRPGLPAAVAPAAGARPAAPAVFLAKRGFKIRSIWRNMIKVTFWPRPVF